MEHQLIIQFEKFVPKPPKGTCVSGVPSSARFCKKGLKMGTYNKISEEKIGLDALKEVGHGHDFLTHPHTLKYLRSEVTFWDGKKLDLLNMDKEEMPAEANKIVKNILDKHQVEPIANDLIEKGDAIIKKYEDRVSNSTTH